MQRADDAAAGKKTAGSFRRYRAGRDRVWIDPARWEQASGARDRMPAGRDGRSTRAIERHCLTHGMAAKRHDAISAC